MKTIAAVAFFFSSVVEVWAGASNCLILIKWFILIALEVEEQRKRAMIGVNFMIEI